MTLELVTVVNDSTFWATPNTFRPLTMAISMAVLLLRETVPTIFRATPATSPVAVKPFSLMLVPDSVAA